MELTLETLGITAIELQDRVVSRIADQVLHGYESSDEEGEYSYTDSMKRKLDEQIKKAIDSAIEKLAADHVLPGVTAMIEGLTLQQTNQWGEKKGKSLTFIEYLQARAEHWISEKVDSQGNGEKEGGYGWSGKQTRLAYLVNHYLHHSIETAMKEALRIANSAIATGIEQTVKVQLEAITKNIRASVSV